VTTAIRSPLLALVPPPAAARDLIMGASASPFSALDWVLADQQSLTAVDRFSRQHDADALPANAKLYRDLIPVAAPGPGQQYAFEVDLDRCTGCKACVTGCHSMNGLDEGEVWRTVGLLHGGTSRAPAQQTVTTSCHHCLEPACLSGCPVKAYEKDPVTGIVKHLDDQCIGCQYCIFMCPYDAPKYNSSRGIVRKCDMCSDRLSAGEAPACVQACPSSAIRIAVVERADAIQASEANTFLPGAPAPGDTLPTTIYKTERVLPRNMLPADFYSVSPEHAHPPLVIMLALTQLSVGAFILSLLSNAIMGGLASRTMQATNALLSLLLAMVALGVMPLHLGRPRYAFRALLGLRTSWLSREILAFSVFALVASAFSAALFFPRVPSTLQAALGYAGAISGVGGVFCSVMVYAATRRVHWRGGVTGFKFSLSAVVLGAATVLMASVVSTSITGHDATTVTVLVSTGVFPLLTAILMVATAVKLTAELSELLHLRDPQHTVLKRNAVLLVGALRPYTRARYLTGIGGGLVLPTVSLLIWRSAANATAPLPYALLAVLSGLSFGLCLVGELLERFLFFAAAPASRMPGSIV
jgi:formate dehydrogenase iron-sulfur subunit